MTFNYNDIVLVDGRPAIFIARNGAVSIFHRLSTKIGVTADTVALCPQVETDVLSNFNTDAQKMRDVLYESGYTTEVQPGIMRVYKPICPMYANRRHICDITMLYNNKKCGRITNIRPQHIRQAAKIAFLMANTKE